METGGDGRKADNPEMEKKKRGGETTTEFSWQENSCDSYIYFPVTALPVQILHHAILAVPT